MSAIRVPRMTPEEYLRRERLAPFKSEFFGGRIVAMSGARRDHGRITENLSISIGVQLRDRPCNSYSSDMRVSIRGGKAYLYPDVVVTCGKEEFESNQFDCLVNPVVVIEVLSTTTELYDRGEKFREYITIPSLREYVLITPSTRRMELFRRQDDGSWRYESWPFTPPPLVLQSIDCTLAPEDIFNKVEPEEESGEESPEPADEGR